MTLLLQKGEEYGAFSDEAPAGDHPGPGPRRSLGGLGLRGNEDQESSEAFTPRDSQDSQELELSSYETARDSSHLDSNVDAWMLSNSTDTGVQSRVPTAQRSTLTLGLESVLSVARLWCLMALLPLLTYQPRWPFRCTPSGLVNSAELLLVNLSWMIERARAQIQRLARDEMYREGWAAVMDALLVVYSVGFLVISMYQAMVIG